MMVVMKGKRLLPFRNIWKERTCFVRVTGLVEAGFRQTPATGGAAMNVRHCLGPKAIVLLWFLFPSLLSSASEMASRPPAEDIDSLATPTLIMQRKTLQRWPDPVIVKGALFPDLLGKKIADMRLLASPKGSLEVIPFQIDEMDKESNFILPSGKYANPEDSNGLLDEQDEILFMARDSGHRVGPVVWSEAAETHYEITLTDPLDGSRSWCYLAWYAEAPPPLSHDDYIHYRPDEPGPHEGPEKKFCTLWSEYYTLGYCVMRPYFDKSDYPEECGVAHHHNSQGEAAGYDSTDYRDRFKVRTRMRFLFGLLNLGLDESGVVYYEEAYKDGAIRHISLFQVKQRFALGIEAPGTRSTLIFYDTFAYLPLTIRIPFNPGYLLHSIQMSLTEDHSPSAYGMLAYNSNNPDGTLIDGVMSPQEKHWNTERDTWRIATGPQGTQMDRGYWDPEYLKQVHAISCVYVDDVSQENPPEDYPGQIGSIWQTNEIRNISRGEYFSHLQWCWIPRFFFSGEGSMYRPGDEKPYLDIMDNLIQVSVEDRSMKNGVFGRKVDYSSSRADNSVVESTIEKGQAEQ